MSGYSLKEYIFPSGRKEQCQGYEPRCFYYLLSIGYEEDDIEVGYKNRESIWYSDPESEGKMCRYYPDGFIKSENAVIEVRVRGHMKRIWRRIGQSLIVLWKVV